MQDLIDKIEQLRKSLAAMKPKDHSSLVPALNPPTVKPLSISSGGGNKPAKLPGVTPASGKDPKKMAEQLKNPRPKKPKIEMLKFEKNGQWNLVDKAETGHEKGIAVAPSPHFKPGVSISGVHTRLGEVGEAKKQSVGRMMDASKIKPNLPEPSVKKFGENNSV